MIGHRIMPRVLSVPTCDWLIESAGSAERISMPHRTHPPFLEIMRSIELRWRVEAELGEASGLGSDYYSVSAGLGTHADNDYVQALPGTFLSIWIALGDVTEQNGPLVIDGKAILCGKGDAVMIDGDTPHRSCAGQGPRPVALFTFIRKGCPFRPGKTQQRAEVDLKPGVPSDARSGATQGRAGFVLPPARPLIPKEIA